MANLNLNRRLVKGSELTASEHDDNLDKLESAIPSIIDNLTSNVATDALAASQGPAIQALINSVVSGSSANTAAISALTNTVSGQGTSIAALQVTAAQLAARLDGFRDAKKIYLSPNGNDANNGTSLGEPLRTFSAAATAAESGDLVIAGPGEYTETSLPIRWKRDVGILGGSLRNVTIKPAVGQEMNGIFKVDSGFWCWGLEFAGHQANATLGQQAWAISFDELADNRSIGAISLGAYIFKSPYIQNCSSVTAEDDRGTAGSQSTGDTGGGILVDGSKCATNSPIRSMVVDSYTQVNLGGPGCLVVNDGYAQLVSFFGTFCEYHVKTLSGGQVNLSGGGTSDFGLYGLIADGYSPSPVFTAKSRLAYFGAARIEKTVTIAVATSLFTATAHGLLNNDEVVFSALNGTLPTPLQPGTTYYVRDRANDTFKVSGSLGGVAITLSGSATGTYQVVRQGVTQVDLLGFTASRLGRQIKYPTAGSAGSPGNPVTITARGGSTAGSTFTVTLGAVPTVKHEYVGGGTVTVGGTSYNITSAVYNNATGVTVLTASGYTPTIGANITLSGLSFICDSASRPHAGQLMFPQLVFPRNATTGAPETKTFTYTKTAANTITFTEAASPTGPEHQYVSGGTVFIGGTDYGVASSTYNKTSGLVTINTKTAVPGSINSTGSVQVGGLIFICPTSAYVVTSSVPIDSTGNEVANNSINKAGYRVYFYSGLNGGLANPLAIDQVLDFRQRSQISAPGHTFEYVGSGMNYDALPWNGGVPNPANKIVELNNGRIYSSNTDQLGNFAVGSQFEVDGTTGAVTINTSQFNLSGLNFIGPFSRNGGISTVGVQIREASNNTSLIASTGASDSNTVPTQFAVRSYVDNRFLTEIAPGASQPITVSDTSTQDAQGYWTRSRSISLSMNTANGLVRLNSSGLIEAAYLPSFVDDVLEYASLAVFPATGETGKIYVALNNNRTYRWSGSTYIEVSPTIGTDLSYNSSTRVVSISTGTGFTLPLFATGIPGLVPAPAAGNETIEYLRKDGSFARPSGVPAGSAGSIQVHDGGATPAPGSVTGLRWDSVNTELDVPGSVNLDDAGIYEVIYQQVTPTGNRSIIFPDKTGVVAIVPGSSYQLVYSFNNELAASPSITFDPAVGLRTTLPFGYTTGAGGTVTQGTSKATAVTLNRPSGEITLNAASLAAATVVSFTFNNSFITATSLMTLNHVSGGTIGAYTMTPSCGAGFATVYVRNSTAGALAEAIVIRYAVINGATS